MKQPNKDKKIKLMAVATYIDGKLVLEESEFIETTVEKFAQKIGLPCGPKVAS